MSTHYKKKILVLLSSACSLANTRLILIVKFTIMHLPPYKGDYTLCKNCSCTFVSNSSDSFLFSFVFVFS